MKLNQFFCASLFSMAITSPASALNIVLTNDDGWETNNTQTLFNKLKAAGHDVILSAPCTGQSGKGGAINFMKPVHVNRTKIENDQACVGDVDTSVKFEDFVEGTPSMSVLFGIDVLAQNKWGKAPDLIISGPNEGNNLGPATSFSGTLGATNMTLSRGIPAIAISAANDDTVNAPLVADAVIEVLNTLLAKQTTGQPILPEYTGLNINTPEDMTNHKGFLFTDLGWTAGFDIIFADDLSQNQTAMYYVAQGILAKGYAETFEQALAIAAAQFEGQSGIAVNPIANDIDEDYPTSESPLLYQGYITISTIEPNHQATRAKTELTRIKLMSLVK